MSAMTAGSTRRMAAAEKVGACQPTTSLPPTMLVWGGKPIQSAAETLSKLVR
jgi:hypothetical protein